MAKQFKQHKILPDSLYNRADVSKLINHVMRKGKKSTARGIVYNAFEIIKQKSKKDPIEIFEKAMENVSPHTEVRGKRVGGATYQVPFPVKAERAATLAMRWIIEASKSQKGKPMQEKLAEELMNASNNTGIALKKKENTHRMAQANRAFAHLAR